MLRHVKRANPAEVRPFCSQPVADLTTRWERRPQLVVDVVVVVVEDEPLLLPPERMRPAPAPPAMIRAIWSGVRFAKSGPWVEITGLLLWTPSACTAGARAKRLAAASPRMVFVVMSFLLEKLGSDVTACSFFCKCEVTLRQEMSSAILGKVVF
ncbi:MAG: hypothetical protein CL868_00800 [Cytophagaceae bacterium]|nr:hypothetical protein [Cytophagaceae bacterium]